MSKWYAIKQGRQPGIYRSWAEAEAQVKGFSAAQFKSFKTEADARDYLTSTTNIAPTTTNIAPTTDITVPTAFTDGSFAQGKAGWGVVLVLDAVNQYYGPLPKEFDPPTNNKAELYAIHQAIIIAIDLKLPNLVIYSDSEYSVNALTQWANTWQRNGWITATGETVANKDLIQMILNLLQSIILIDLRWVKAHNGHQWNDMADQLAEMGRREY